jgi:hypothetical protein
MTLDLRAKGCLSPVSASVHTVSLGPAAGRGRFEVNLVNTGNSHYCQYIYLHFSNTLRCPTSDIFSRWYLLVQAGTIEAGSRWQIVLRNEFMLVLSNGGDNIIPYDYRCSPERAIICVYK